MYIYLVSHLQDIQNDNVVLSNNDRQKRTRNYWLITNYNFHWKISRYWSTFWNGESIVLTIKWNSKFKRKNFKKIYWKTEKPQAILRKIENSIIFILEFLGASLYLIYILMKLMQSRYFRYLTLITLHTYSTG